MSDWIDGLADEVVKADEQMRQRQAQKERALNVSKVLGLRAPDLWAQLVESCQEAVKKLNERNAVRFPADQSKQITLEKPKPNSFTIGGKCPAFSMAVTYAPDQHHVSLGGQKTFEGSGEGRSGLVLMDLDETGTPCFVDVERHRVSVSGVVRYILELSMATTKPMRPTG